MGSLQVAVCAVVLLCGLAVSDGTAKQRYIEPSGPPVLLETHEDVQVARLEFPADAVEIPRDWVIVGAWLEGRVQGLNRDVEAVFVAVDENEIVDGIDVFALPSTSSWEITPLDSIRNGVPFLKLDVTGLLTGKKGNEGIRIVVATRDLPGEELLESLFTSRLHIFYIPDVAAMRGSN